ncbi:MAG: CDP-archaeol synthase [Pseudomonadota bacterium]
MNSRTETVDLVAMSLKKSHLAQPQFELLTRALSASVLIPFFLWITYTGGWLFYSALTLVFTAALREWSRLSTNSIFHPLCLFAIIGLAFRHLNGYELSIQIIGAIAFVGALYYQRLTLFLPSLQRWMLFLGGLVYITAAMESFILLSEKNQKGSLLIIWLYGIVWATDSGAYIIGRAVKGPKLSPRISPNKTWSGFIGGIILSILTGQYLLKAFDISLSSSVPNVALILLLSLTAHSGDLIESAVKRYFGVKNAGDLIPGHGGILDRLDSLLFVVIVMGLLVLLNIITV